MFNHFALLDVGQEYQPVLDLVDGKFYSIEERETTGEIAPVERYQHLCFQTENEISSEQERQLLALPGVSDVGLNQQ